MIRFDVFSFTGFGSTEQFWRRNKFNTQNQRPYKNFSTSEIRFMNSPQDENLDGEFDNLKTFFVQQNFLI